MGKSGWQKAYEELQEKGTGEYLGQYSGSGLSALGAIIMAILLKQSKGNAGLGCLFFFVDIGVLALVGYIIYLMVQ